jgi:hypothetical protein
MTEQGNIQSRTSNTNLITKAGQYTTGLPVASGTTESYSIIPASMEGSDLISETPKLVNLNASYVNMTRDAGSSATSILVNQPYGYIGQTYVQPINLIGGTGGTGGTGPPATTTYYKMRGYYVAGGVWETWVSTGSPGSPPSGHTLVDTVIVSKWTV